MPNHNPTNMKKLTLVLATLLISFLSFAQAPQSFNYQAVVRDVTGQEITNTTVGIQISLLQTSTEGTVVYIEQFTQETNNFGLLNLMIGTGDVQTGTFSSIIWGDGPYFLKVELDETGGTDYIEIGTSQLLSVPYALHAKTAETITGTITESQVSDLQFYLTVETDPVFAAWDQSTGISITESQISDLQTYLTAETDPVFAA